MADEALSRCAAGPGHAARPVSRSGCADGDGNGQITGPLRQEKALSADKIIEADDEPIRAWLQILRQVERDLGTDEQFASVIPGGGQPLRCHGCAIVLGDNFVVVCRIEVDEHRIILLGLLQDLPVRSKDQTVAHRGRCSREIITGQADLLTKFSLDRVLRRLDSINVDRGSLLRGIGRDWYLLEEGKPVDQGQGTG